MENVLAEVIKELNEKEVMKHVAWFTENTPKRISGTGDDKKAAEYIVQKMTKYGLDARLLEFETYNSWPKYSELKVLSPDTYVIESLPCCHSASTLPEGITASLEYVGAGAEEDYLDKDVKGKIVLVEVSYSPATPEKARIAAKMGAAAMICMNWGGEEDVICMRGLKAVWGNPTEETFTNIPQIAGVSISRQAGEFLINLLKKYGKIEVLLKSQSTRHWEKLVQPMAILKGSHEPEKFLLVTAHLDAWEPGVTCNATGDGVTLELARVLAKFKNELKRSVYFVFWNGHEIAEAAGSTWFVDHFWDDLRDNCIGYINIDSPGMKDATEYEVRVSRELSDFADITTRSFFNGEMKMEYLTKIGDQSFFGIGIPSITSRSSFNKKYIEETHGATLGWWNHTKEDGLDKVDIDNLKQDLIINCAHIFELINRSVIPYDFSKTCEDIRIKLQKIIDGYEDKFRLKVLLTQIKSLEKKVNELNQVKHLIIEETNSKKVKIVNDASLKLSRILTSPFYTYCDRYNQDSYGLSVLSKPIPLLYRVMEMEKIDPSSIENKVLYTTLVRNRNRVSDAINDALQCIESSLRLLGLE